MAETSTHLEVIFAVWAALRVVSERVTRTFVGSNQLVYYEQDNIKKCFALDCYILQETDHTEPPNILTWIDGVPACIIEVTSKKTRRKDIYDKFQLYQALGVQEYVMFDPLEDYLKPSLQVHRLTKGKYLPQLANAEGRFPLQVLPVELYREGRWLRVWDAQTGEHLPLLGEERTHRQAADRERTRAEQERFKAEQERQMAELTARIAQQALEQERIRSEQEHSRAEQAHSRAEQERIRAEQAHSRAEQAHSRAEQERIRAEQEHSRAEQERSRAEQAHSRAEQERSRAEAAEAQLRELHALLARLNQTDSER